MSSARPGRPSAERGIGSVAGVAIAAAVLSALPAWFQAIGDYKLLVYGALLFLMMRFSPGGMAAIARRFFSPTAGSGQSGQPGQPADRSQP